jgi:hypothetical protein
MKLLASSEDGTTMETSQPLLEHHTAEAGRSSTGPTGTHMDKTPSSQTNLAGNRVGTEVTSPTTVRDPDGDAIVDVEATETKNQRRRQVTYEMSAMHRQLVDAQQENMDDGPDLSTMLRRFEAILKTQTHDAVKALDTRQKVWEQSILHLQKSSSHSRAPATRAYQTP